MDYSKKDVQKAMEEKFQAMMEKAKTDPNLKKEVMMTINRIENISTLLDLFTIKMVKTETSIIKGISGDNEDNQEE